MPGPSSRIRDSVDIDREHARRVRVSPCNRCRRPPRSSRTGVHHAGRFVSSLLPLCASTPLVYCANGALRAVFAVARSRSNVRSDRGRRLRGKRFCRFMIESLVMRFDPFLEYKLQNACIFFPC